MNEPEMNAPGAPREDTGSKQPLPVAPTERRGAAWRLKKISDVALEVGVSAQFIRNAINDAKHPLPWEKKAGDWQVKAGEVYDWVCAHAKRRPPNLQKPAGYEAQPLTDVRGSDDALPAELLISNDEDVLGLLNRALNDKAASPEQLRVLAALAGQMRLYFTEKFKREKMIPVADAVKMLRSFGELIVELIEEHAEPLALDVIKNGRDHLDHDFGAQNPSAKDIFKSGFCEYFNKHFIPAIQQHVRDQVDGVEVLELGAE